jgi:uncharacterized protein YlxP (DUF503 family)
VHVGVQTFQLSLPGCGSLKEKRMVVKSLRARIRNRFNVAVAETGFHDVSVRAQLTVAALGSDRGRVDGILEKVDRFVEADGRFLVASVKREFR